MIWVLFLNLYNDIDYILGTDTKYGLNFTADKNIAHVKRLINFFPAILNLDDVNDHDQYY